MSDRMSEMDSRDSEMDSLLRRSLAAPVPRLSPDFELVFSRKLRRRSEPLHPFGRIFLGGYGAVSAVVSVVVMRGQGLGWIAIAATMLGALATLEVARLLGRRQWRMAA